MASDFEKQQRWQLALFGLYLWGPVIGLAAIGGVVAWLLTRAPMPGLGGGW